MPPFELGKELEPVLAQELQPVRKHWPKEASTEGWRRWKGAGEDGLWADNGPCQGRGGQDQPGQYSLDPHPPPRPSQPYLHWPLGSHISDFTGAAPNAIAVA